MEAIVLERTRLLPLMMAICIMLGTCLPYLFTVAADKVNSFLPYISHSAAFPPQSALLTIFTAIGTFFALPTLLLRFVSVDQKRRRLEPKKIRALNFIAVAIGCLAAIAMLLSSNYPIGFVTHAQVDWMAFVVFPHFAGTFLLVSSYTLYVLIQSYLTYVHRKKSSKNVFFHATLAMCVVITCWTSCLPFYAAMRDMGPSIVDADTGEITLESKEYSFYYIISALSQWAFTFFSILFIATFYRDLKHMRVVVKVREKKLASLRIDTTAHARTNGSEEITKM